LYNATETTREGKADWGKSEDLPEVRAGPSELVFCRAQARLDAKRQACQKIKSTPVQEYAVQKKEFF
jgi:hypothetical protein